MDGVWRVLWSREAVEMDACWPVSVVVDGVVKVRTNADGRVGIEEGELEVAPVPFVLSLSLCLCFLKRGRHVGCWNGLDLAEGWCRSFEHSAYSCKCSLGVLFGSSHLKRAPSTTDAVYRAWLHRVDGLCGRGTLAC